VSRDGLARVPNQTKPCQATSIELSFRVRPKTEQADRQDYQNLPNPVKGF